MNQKTSYYLNGNIKKEQWFNDNKELHREGDLPAKILYFNNGFLKYQGWYKNNQLHREGDLPAIIWYHRSGAIDSQKWLIKGKNLQRHHNQPNEIHYTSDGIIDREVWCDRVNLNLPSDIFYTENGNKEFELFKYNYLSFDKDFFPTPNKIIYYDNGSIKRDYSLSDKDANILKIDKFRMIYLLRKWCNKYKKLTRKRVFGLLLETKLNKNNGEDICKFIAKFI